MSTRRESMRRFSGDGDFLFVGFDGGKIIASTFFRSPAVDAYRAGQARALIFRAKSFHVYRLVNDAAGELKFERVKE